MGTFGGGLSKAERDANGTITRWKQYIHQPDNPRSLSHNYIWALLETRNNADSAQTPPNTPPSGKNISRTFQTRLWIGTDDGTVSEFHRESGTFTHHKYQRLEKSVNAPIQTLYQDRKGRIWVGTWGVYRQRVRTLEKCNRELQHLVDERTAEIRRQIALLDEQAKEIQMVNVAMSEKNQALEESNTKLAEADSFKTRILSIAARDLKNPLVSITGFSEIMLFDLTETNPHLPMVQAIARSSEQMLDLINNILDASAIEMGKIQLHEEIFDFGYVCVSASESHQYAAELKSQTLHFDTDYHCMVRDDQKRLTQVADNLVSNAIKYSPSGADIRISVKKNHAFTWFSVQDQGPGLTNDDKEKLFGFFQRLSARPTGNESSNGVGLAIVKQIVELHGGRVWAESEYGQGSTFIIEMPLVQEGISDEE